MICTVSAYGSKFKINCFKSDNPFHLLSDKSASNSDNLNKLDNNLSRAKSRIRELAFCNDWEYFVTMTVAPEAIGVDRYSLQSIIKKLGYFLQNQNKKYNANIKYLLIPEQHKDGAYHFHGLFHDIPDNALSINQYGYLDYVDYKKRFGFCSLSPIKSKEKCANYITKYVTKDIASNTSIEKGKHLFYASRGLKGAERMDIIDIKKTFVDKLGLYENDYVITGLITQEQLMELYRHLDSSDIIDRTEFMIEKQETLDVYAQQLQNSVNIFGKGE